MKMNKRGTGLPKLKFNSYQDVIDYQLKYICNSRDAAILRRQYFYFNWKTEMIRGLIKK